MKNVLVGETGDNHEYVVFIEDNPEYVSDHLQT